MNTDSHPITERDAAVLIGCSEACLRRWRRLGKGPDFIKMGQRMVRYERAAVDRFLASNTNRGAASNNQASN